MNIPLNIPRYVQWALARITENKMKNSTAYIILDLLLLLPLLAVGLVTAKEDIESGKIRNKWIMAGFVLGFFVYFIFGIGTILAQTGLFPVKVFLAPSFYLQVLANSAVGFAVGYLLWHFKVWSAGDAKLFSLFIFLIPLRHYSRTYLDIFPGFALLMNIFIPLFSFLSLASLAFFIKRIAISAKKRNEARQRMAERAKDALLAAKDNWKKAVFAFTILYSVLLLFGGLRQIAGETIDSIVSSQALLFVMLFFLYRAAMNAAIRSRWLAVFCLALAAAYLAYGALFSPAILAQALLVLKRTAFFMAVFSLIHWLTDRYMSKKGAMSIAPDSLKARMIIPEEVMACFRQREGKEGDIHLEDLGKVYAEGLTRGQAEIIRGWCRTIGLKEVKVCTTIPFAPFVLLGAAITVIFQGSVFHIILNLMKG